MKQNILIIIFIGFICACCTNSTPTPVNLLSGKLKTLDIIDNNTNSQRHLNYIYDSSGAFKSLIGDSLKFYFTNQNTNSILLKIDILSQDAINNSKQTYRIAFSASNQVQNIYLVDTISQVENLTAVANYNNINIIDTFTEKGNFNFVHDIENYEYFFDGNNYTQHTASWYIYTIFDGDVNYLDTLKYTYYPLINNNFVPLQQPYVATSYVLIGSTQNNLIPYLLEIKGYSIFKRNQFLIKSVKSTNYGYITNYDYTINALNQVTEMRISKPDGTGTALTYKMTYH